MQIAESKTRDQFPLSPKKIIKKTITGTIFFFILFLIVSFIFGSALISTGNFGFGAISIFIFFMIFLAIFILTYLYERWYFAVYFYDLTPDFIQIKKGPITPREITIPYERIQDVYVDQDIFDRIFGLYDVHLSSATAASGMAAHIDGVEHEAAMGLREVLLKTVGERISKNGQSSNRENISN